MFCFSADFAHHSCAAASAVLGCGGVRVRLLCRTAGTLMSLWLMAFPPFAPFRRQSTPSQRAFVVASQTDRSGRLEKPCYLGRMLGYQCTDKCRCRNDGSFPRSHPLLRLRSSIRLQSGKRQPGITQGCTCRGGWVTTFPAFSRPASSASGAVSPVPGRSGYARGRRASCSIPFVLFFFFFFCRSCSCLLRDRPVCPLDLV